MEDKKTRRGLRLLSLVLLAALTLGFWPAAARTVDLESTCAVSVTPGGPDMAEDLLLTELVLDVYRVADAAELSGEDSYTFAVTKDFAAVEDIEATLSDRDIDKDGWAALGQAVLAEIQENADIAPEKSVAADEVSGKVLLTELAAGLYLFVPRSAALTEKADYIKTITDEDGEETLVSIANSMKYEYRFTPQLLALPTKEGVTGEDGSVTVNTADPTEWLYGTEAEPLSVMLKPGRVERYGSLEIVKTLQSIEHVDGESFVGGTFVFQVTATLLGSGGEEETVYSNVTAITINDPSELSKSVTLEKIPAGATATVEEIYSGASYEQVVDEDAVQTVVITAADEETASVSFTNRYDGSGNRGHGILNDFKYTENGWSSQQIESLNAQGGAA